MTAELFSLYLLTRLEGLGVVIIIGCLISGIVTVLSLIFWLTECNEDFKQIFKKVRWWLAGFVLAALLVPTKQDAMFIVAGTGVIEAAKTDTAQRLAGKSVKVLESYLDKLSETKK